MKPPSLKGHASRDMAKLNHSFEKVKRIDTLWSLIDRLGIIKAALIALSTGGVVTFAVSWLQHLPRWVQLSIVFIAASVCALIVFVAVGWLYFKAQAQIKKMVHAPLQERLKALENKIGPRCLGKEQREIIWNSLGTKPGRIRISAINPDSDAASYAEEFAEFLRARGWDVWGPDMPYEGRCRLDGMEIGIFLVTPYDEPSTPYEGAQRLSQAMQEAGIPLHYQVTFELHKGACELVIGHRGTPDHD